MKAIVFDLDGTLIDSAPDIHAAVNRLLADEGLGNLTLPVVKSFIGEGVGVLMDRVMAASGLPPERPLHDRLLARFLDDYQSAVAQTRLFPGVAQALTTLAARGWALGLCTNKPMAPTRSVLAHCGLQDCFATVTAGDSLPQRKPDPAPLRATIRALGAGAAVYVGDSEVDAECASRAALPFALFTEGYRKTPVAGIAHQAAFDDYARLADLADTLLG